jgi:hypothetical protein
MKDPTPDYPFVAVQEALQSLSGAGAAMLLVCALGGAVPTVAGWNRFSSAEDWILLTIAWIWHWAMAGLMVWGLLALLVPVWCFHELLNGNRSVHQVLAIAMITQLIVSTVAVCIFAYEDQRIRPIVASGCTILVIVVSLWASRPGAGAGAPPVGRIQ